MMFGKTPRNMYGLLTHWPPTAAGRGQDAVANASPTNFADFLTADGRGSPRPAVVTERVSFRGGVWRVRARAIHSAYEPVSECLLFIT